jgi:L-glutamine-phosphate cytidylyltransferase
MSIRAIVLAAGEGTRLRPYTVDRPKCLVTFDGATLLEHQRAALTLAGVDDVTVVSGHGREAFDGIDIATRVNQLYATTNMVASLMCARDLLDGSSDVLVAYGDIVYESRVVHDLLDADASLATTVDRRWRRLWSLRMEEPLDDAETLRIDERGVIVDIGRRATSYDQVQAQYMGLILIRSEIVATVVDTFDELDPMGDYRGRTRDQMFMTTFLALLGESVAPLHAVEVDGGWLEFDEVADLERYEQLRRTGALDEQWRSEVSR